MEVCTVGENGQGKIQPIRGEKRLAVWWLFVSTDMIFFSFLDWHSPWNLSFFSISFPPISQHDFLSNFPISKKATQPKSYLFSLDMEFFTILGPLKFHFWLTQRGFVAILCPKCSHFPWYFHNMSFDFFVEKKWNSSSSGVRPRRYSNLSGIVKKENAVEKTTTLLGLAKKSSTSFS